MTVLAIDRCPMKTCRVRVSTPRPASAYPAECRNMWAWIGNGSMAASPSRSMSFWAPSIDKGALRSLRNRKRLCSPFSRISCRIKRSSSPCSPWMPGVPFLARRICTVAALRSNCSTVRETSSETRSACRNARRMSSSSRTGLRFLRAALRSLSISGSVKYSRDRNAAFGLRPPPTVGFSDCEGLSRTTGAIGIFPSNGSATISIMRFLATVQDRQAQPSVAAGRPLTTAARPALSVTDGSYRTGPLPALAPGTPLYSLGPIACFSQTTWADHEAPLQVAASDQLLHKQAGHDRFAGTRIVRQRAAHGLAWQHRFVNGGDLVWQGVHDRRVYGQDRVK